MNECEIIGEELPLSQRQQQQQQQRSPRRKRTDEGKTSTSDPTQHQQLKPNDFDRPSRSSISSVESMEVVHVRRPSSVSRRHRRRSPIKSMRRGVLVVSVIMFAAGLLTTVTSSPFIFYFPKLTYRYLLIYVYSMCIGLLLAQIFQELPT